MRCSKAWHLLKAPTLRNSETRVKTLLSSSPQVQNLQKNQLFILSFARLYLLYVRSTYVVCCVTSLAHFLCKRALVSLFTIIEYSNVDVRDASINYHEPYQYSLYEYR